MYAEAEFRVNARTGAVRNLPRELLRSLVAYHLLGAIHYAAAVRASRTIRVKGSTEDRLAAAVPHLRVTLEALATAHCLAPDCVHIAATLGDALVAARMHAGAPSPAPPQPAASIRACGVRRGVRAAEKQAEQGRPACVRRCPSSSPRFLRLLLERQSFCLSKLYCSCEANSQMPSHFALYCWSQTEGVKVAHS